MIYDIKCRVRRYVLLLFTVKIKDIPEMLADNLHLLMFWHSWYGFIKLVGTPHFIGYFFMRLFKLALFWLWSLGNLWWLFIIRLIIRHWVLDRHLIRGRLFHFLLLYLLLFRLFFLLLDNLLFLWLLNFFFCFILLFILFVVLNCKHVVVLDTIL